MFKVILAVVIIVVIHRLVERSDEKFEYLKDSLDHLVKQEKK